MKPPYEQPQTFLGIWPAFFARRARKEVRELFLSTAVVDLAIAMAFIFEPIYLYTRGFTLKQIIYFYLSVYLLYFLLMPLGAKYAKRYGFEHSILLSTPFVIINYVGLILLPVSNYFIILTAVALALDKTFYWPGYHGDFAHYGVSEQRGREASNMALILSFVYVLGPLLGGFIIKFFGFTALFILVSLLVVISNVPLFITLEKFEPSEFFYFRAYRRLFKKENRKAFFAYLGFGEEFILQTLWPIFIFLIVKDFSGVGALAAGATLVTAIIILYTGKITDQTNKNAVLKGASIFYSFSWFLKILTSGAFGVFLVDTVGRTFKDVKSVPLTAITYERGREVGVMKTVVFFEMSLVIGKVMAMLLALLILSYWGPYPWAPIFTVAGLFTLLYGLLHWDKS